MICPHQKSNNNEHIPYINDGNPDIYVASSAHLPVPERGDPSSGTLLQASSFNLKAFFLIWFEGLRTEDATTMQLVKPFKANMIFLALNKLDFFF